MINLQPTILRALRKTASLVLPPRKRLPFYCWLDTFPYRGQNDIWYLHKMTTQHETAVDVGANVGLFSYHMSKHFKKVYSFEINSDNTKDLAAYNPGNIELIPQGLSSHDGNTTLYIPVLNGNPLPGWASLKPGNCPQTQEHIEKTVHITTLDSFCLKNVSLIKIDVEGHEMEVLKGAKETLVQNRPVIIIEIRPENELELRAFFDGIDYEEKGLEDLIGVGTTGENCFFIPRPV